MERDAVHVPHAAHVPVRVGRLGHAPDLHDRVAAAVLGDVERAGLDAVAGHAAPTEEQVFQTVAHEPPAGILAPVAIPAPGCGDDGGAAVVLEVGAHSGQVERHGQAVRAQVVGRSYAGHHQELRSGEGARRHDHLARLDDAALPPAFVLDAGGARPVEDDADGAGAEADREARVAREGGEEGVHGAAAAPVARRHLDEPRAARRAGVEVAHEGLAQRLGRQEEEEGRAAHEARVGDPQRPVDAVEGAREARVALQADEVGEHRDPRPQVRARGPPPGVVVGGATAGVGLGVDAAAAAQDAGLGDELDPPAELRLGQRAVLGEVARAAEDAAESSRGAQQEAPVGPPRLQEQDAPAPLAREPRGGQAPRGAAADHHVVEGLRHRTPAPCMRPRM